MWTLLLLLSLLASEAKRTTTPIPPHLRIQNISGIDFARRPLNFYIVANGKHAKIENRTATINGEEIFYRESFPPFSIKHRGDVLLLHGKASSSAEWTRERPSLLQMLAASGHRTVALDLPGFGSGKSKGQKPADPADFLFAFVKTVGLQNLTLVAPSSSGVFAVPFIGRFQKSLEAIVPFDVCCAAETDWKRVEIPVLIINGKEESPPAAAPNHRVETVATEAPEELARLLVNFLDVLHPR
ncbi:hypothetical protein QR680_012616 [Steinernema hermaphroditum]|uniref:AB hydrolase-1 domain-containing protein n=1 Tax=Steinernema hermaphroditum TaxID=289476 RepID=A0AA39I2L0_9BILA|nr:hypothetical protein QR680_012616 [Steinernema hermaphroditum]